MVNIRSVVACLESGRIWVMGAEPAGCTDQHHHHDVIAMHVHNDVVALPDGCPLVAASLDPVDPYTRRRAPDFGLYFDSCWHPPWKHADLDWPDFGVPADILHVHDALMTLLDRARAGERVEIGCRGGHGRTGTALACLVVLTGHPASEAVEWVRTHYCSEAVETSEQESFVIEFNRR